MENTTIEKRSKPTTNCLNIIYFTDGGKTKTLKIPFFFIKMGVFIFLLIGSWAFLGSLYFVNNVQKLNRVSARLQSTLETLFQYQVKHDAIYETVYSLEKSGPTDLPKTQVGQDDRVKSAPNSQSSSETHKTKNLLDAKYLKVLSDKDWVVAVENPFLSKNEKKLTLSIVLKNKKNQTRAEGLIWATAEWLDSKGTKHIVNAPEDNEKKDLKQPNAATYSIRQYKVKKFSFSIPDSGVSLSKIEIWLSDKESQKVRFEISEAETTLRETGLN